MENPERSRFSFDGYVFGREDQPMGEIDAEEAIYLELLRENDSLSKPMAKQLAADFIRNSRNVHIVASENGIQRHYLGGDPFMGRRPLGFGCY